MEGNSRVINQHLLKYKAFPGPSQPLVRPHQLQAGPRSVLPDDMLLINPGWKSFMWLFAGSGSGSLAKGARATFEDLVHAERDEAVVADRKYRKFELATKLTEELMTIDGQHLICECIIAGNCLMFLPGGSIRRQALPRLSCIRIRLRHLMSILPFLPTTLALCTTRTILF